MVVGALALTAGCDEEKPGSGGDDGGTNPAVDGSTPRDSGTLDATVAGDCDAMSASDGCGPEDAGGDGGDTTYWPEDECPNIATALGWDEPPRGLIRLYEGRAHQLALGGEYLYFVTDEGIMRLPVAGGEPETVIGAAAPAAMVTDGSDLYWVEAGSDDGSTPSRLWKRPLGADDAPSSLAEDLDPQDGLLLVDGWVVWESDEGPFNAVPTTGGAVTELDPTVDPVSAASHGGKLYALDYANDALVEVPLDGGSFTRLSGIFWGGDLTADGEGLYWADGSEGAVNRFAYGASERETITRGEWPEAIVSGGGHLYWQERNVTCTTLYTAPTGGGVKRLAMQTSSDVSSRTASDQYLFLAFRGAFSTGEGVGIYRIGHPVP